MSNIVIDFSVKNEEILHTIELLEKIGTVEKGTAAEFKKSAAARQAANEAAQTAAQETYTETEKLKNSLKELPKIIAGGAVDTQIKKIGDAATATEKKTTSLRLQLRQMKNELNTLDEGSARFNKLSIEAAKLEDKIGDVSQRVRNLASDTKGINALISGAQGITGAFAVAEGTAAIFGQGQEEIQKTLLKVNAAMAILNGLQQIQAVFLEESAAKSYLAATAQGVYATVVGTSTGALKVFRIALAATGIGLFVLAIAALITNFDKVKTAISNTFPALGNLGELWDKIKQKFFGFLAGFFEGMKVVGQILKDFFTGDIFAVIEDVRTAGQKIGKAFNDAVEKEVKDQADDRAKALLESLIQSQKRAIAVLEAGGKDSYNLRAKQLQDELKLLKTNGAKAEDIYDKETEILVLNAAHRKEINDKKKQDEDALFDALITARKNEYDVNNKLAANEKKDTEDQAAYKLKVAADTAAALKKIKDGQAAVDAISEANYEKGQADAKAKALKAEDDFQQAKKELIQSSFDFAKSVNDAYLNYELSQFDEQLRSKQISQEQYDAKVREAKRKQAQIDKALSIFNIAISTSEAIVAALKIAPPAGEIFAIARGLAGAAQLAAVASKPIPAFKKGTKNAPPGFKWVGEAGPELIHTPGGDTILPHGKSVEFAQMFYDNKVPMIPNLSYNSPVIINAPGQGFDYNKLGKVIAKEIGNNVPKELNITVLNNNRTEYNNKKYGFN